MKSNTSTLQNLEKRLLAIPRADELLEEERAALRAARFVKDTREAAHLSQSKLASALHVSQARVSQLESGSGTYGATVGMLERVAAACGGTLKLEFVK